MVLLVLGLALWWAPHVAKLIARDFRARTAARIGEGPWRGIVALVTLGAIILMVIGYRSAAFIPLWYPPVFLWHLNNLLMALAVFIFIAGFFKSPIRRAIRNPQLTGVKLWAVAHLLVNGDLASVIFFGGILAWAVVAVIATKRRDGPRGELPESTMGGLVLHLIAAGFLFVVIASIHLWLGVSPFPGGG